MRVNPKSEEAPRRYPGWENHVSRSSQSSAVIASDTSGLRKSRTPESPRRSRMERSIWARGWPDMATTWGGADNRFSRLITSAPLIPGKPRSTNTRSLGRGHVGLQEALTVAKGQDRVAELADELDQRISHAPVVLDDVDLHDGLGPGDPGSHSLKAAVTP